MKTCTKCFVEKPPEGFYFQKNKGSKGGCLSAYCKTCTCSIRKAFRDANVELIRERKHQYHINHREKRNKSKRDRRLFLRKTNPSEIVKRDKERWLKYVYGITIEKYESMRAEQNDSCAICKKKFVAGGKKTNFGVDHCHKTGKVRGLLCYHCNAALGMVLENEEIILSMIAYLRRYKREHESSAVSVPQL